MAYIKIHCADCGVVREIHKYMPDGSDVRYCPLCGSEIDADIWETYVLPAAERLNKANHAIIEKHATENTPAAYIAILADHITMDDI